MDIRYHQIASLICVADKGGFTAAAEELFVTPSALIQQVNNLERNLEFKVFERNSKGCVLTEAGRSFVEGARQLMGEFDVLVESSRAIARQAHRIRFGAYSNWQHEYVYAAFFSLFEAAHPDIEIVFVEVDREDVLDGCKKGAFDVCMYSAERSVIEAAGLVYHPLDKDTVSAVVSPDSPFATKGCVRIPDLVGRVVYADENHANSQLADAFSALEPIDVKLAAYTAVSMFRECSNGACFLMPTRKAFMFPPLVGVPLDPPLPYQTGLVTRRETWPALDAFVQTFVETQ